MELMCGKRETMKPQTSWGVGDRGGEEGDKETESHLPGSQEALSFLHLIELHELCFFQNSVSSRSFCILQINYL